MSDKIAIIIPAYNEEASIGNVLEGLQCYEHIIVVDDGSRDKTVSIAEKNGAIVVKHEVNKGYDGALRSGLLKAIEIEADIAITIDADGQHNPGNIEQILKKAQESEADCVIGTRPSRARISEKIFCIYTRLRFGITDILSGLKAYRTSVLKEYLDALELNSAGTAVALKMAKKGRKIYEVPIEIRPRKGSARIGNALKANMYIFGAMLKTL